jgi:hypothetical protein
MKINPVRATLLKYKDGNCGLQAINDTCFGICAAFNGVENSQTIDPSCAKSCEELIESRRIAKFGVGSCDHQAPYRPVVWDQVPHYLPQLLKKIPDSRKAKQVCMKMCDERVPNMDTDCKINCETDYNAIVQDDNVHQGPHHYGMDHSKSPQSKPSPLFWSIFGVALVAILILIFFSVKAS